MKAFALAVTVVVAALVVGCGLAQSAKTPHKDTPTPTLTPTHTSAPTPTATIDIQATIQAGVKSALATRDNAKELDEAREIVDFANAALNLLGALTQAGADWSRWYVLTVPKHPSDDATDKALDYLMTTEKARHTIELLYAPKEAREVKASLLLAADKRVDSFAEMASYFLPANRENKATFAKAIDLETQFDELALQVRRDLIDLKLDYERLLPKE